MDENKLYLSMVSVICGTVFVLLTSLAATCAWTTSTCTKYELNSTGTTGICIERSYDK